MDVSKLGALFPKPVAAPSNGQSLGQVHKHMTWVKSKKKLFCPIAFGFGQESLPIPRAQFFLQIVRKGDPCSKNLFANFVQFSGFRVISGPWNIP